MSLEVLEELIEMQKDKMLRFAKQIYPFITPDDLLQPNDFLKLENDALFRYEEGILAGLLMAKSALLAEIATC